MGRGLIRVRTPQKVVPSGLLRRVKNGPSSVGEDLAKAIRFGPGGFSEQFIGQASIVGKGTRRPWRRTRPFGSQPSPFTTLFRTGQYVGAWLGRNAGSVFRISNKNLQIGVDSRRFPQVRVFQSRVSTVQRVTNRQRFYLGLTFGVWMRPGGVITNHPRAFTMNDQIRQRTGKVLAAFVATGKRGGV